MPAGPDVCVLTSLRRCRGAQPPAWVAGQQPEGIAAALFHRTPSDSTGLSLRCDGDERVVAGGQVVLFDAAKGHSLSAPRPLSHPVRKPLKS